MALRTLVSADDSLYQYWQMELLHRSFERSAQPGAFTALLAVEKGRPRHAPSCPTFRTRSYAHDGGDDYPVFNKPGSILEWLARSEERDETVLLVDPDCLFLAPLAREVAPGRPVSQYVSYMEIDTPQSRGLLERHCRRNRRLVRPVGIPTLMHQSDWRGIAPRWWELTRDVRADRKLNWNARWISDMWAFAFACAEAGLRLRVERELCQNTLERADHRPILHYCYAIRHRPSGYRWHKREYEPWLPPEPPPRGINPSGRLLLAALDEMSRLRRRRRLRPRVRAGDRSG